MHLWPLAGLVVALAIYWSPVWWRATTGTAPSYIPATVALAAVVGITAVFWRVGDDATPVKRASFRIVTAALAVTALLGFGAYRWVDRAIWNPLGSGGDMLLVVHEAMRNLLRGRDPYAMYSVPWQAPLPYGPMLWAPFLVAEALRIDFRLVTVAGALFVPLWCGVAAVADASRMRMWRAVLWLAVLTALVLHPAFLQFIPTGHTAAYWPLLVLFAALMSAERWVAAGVVLGLLIAARSTMVSIAPVFAIALLRRDRKALWKPLAACAVVVAALMLPFVVWNPATFWYGMVASYPKVMREVVWCGPEHGLAETIGITGWLVPHGYGNLVMPANIVALVLVYMLAWRAIGRGDRPLPWMALALLAFSMTTLWPVYYIYLDVFLLLASAAVADALAPAHSRHIVAAWAGSIAIVAALTAVALRAQASSRPALDFESDASPKALHHGFPPFNRTLAWVWGQTGTFIVPRAAALPADIVVTLQPVIAENDPPQRIVALLNGSLLGAVDVSRGWQSVRFRAPRDAWWIGSNTLELRSTSSARPIDVGLGDDPRHMSLAVRRVEVRP